MGESGTFQWIVPPEEPIEKEKPGPRTKIGLQSAHAAAQANA